MEKLVKLSIVAVLVGIFAVAAPIEASYAQSAGATIEKRKALMKEMNGHLKAVRKFIKGPKKGLSAKKLKRSIARLGTAGDMELRAIAVSGQSGRLAAYFTKGTSPSDGAGKTRAKPEIWAQWGDFKAAAAKMGKLADSLSDASASGDKAKMKAAATALGKKGCGGCHEDFRAPKKKKKSS